VRPSQVGSEFFFNMSTRMPSHFLLSLIDHVRELFDPIFKSFEHCRPTLFPQPELHRVYNQWSGALSADECHLSALSSRLSVKMSLEHNQLMKFFMRRLCCCNLSHGSRAPRVR
jgi:hypothetical protein